MQVEFDCFVQSHQLMDLANGKGVKAFVEEVETDRSGNERRQRLTVKIWHDGPAADQAQLFATRGNKIRVRGRVSFRRFKSPKYDMWLDDSSVEVESAQQLPHRSRAGDARADGGL